MHEHRGFDLLQLFKIFVFAVFLDLEKNQINVHKYEKKKEMMNHFEETRGLRGYEA